MSCAGSDSMFQDTYVTASIVDSHGTLACQTGVNGNFLAIANNSSRFPAYYGLSGVLNRRLLPNQKENLNVSPYFNKSQPPMDFTQSVYLKYWVQDAKDTSHCASMYDYYRSLDAVLLPAARSPQDYSLLRDQLAWQSDDVVHFDGGWGIQTKTFPWGYLKVILEPSGPSERIYNRSLRPLFIEYSCPVWGQLAYYAVRSGEEREVGQASPTQAYPQAYTCRIRTMNRE